MVELLKISEIKLNPNNPRFIKNDDFRRLVESIKTFPQMLFVRPIVINTEGFALGGNMRRRAIYEVFQLVESERLSLFNKCKDLVLLSSLGEVAKVDAIEQAEKVLLRKLVPVMRVDSFTEQQEKEFIVKDNGAWGEWDMELLANDWSDLPLEDWGVKVPIMEEADEKPKAKESDLEKLVLSFEKDVYDDVCAKIDKACLKLGVDNAENLIIELLKKF